MVHAVQVENPVTSGVSSKILSIIFDYALNKFDDYITREQQAAGTPKFLSVIAALVRDNRRVEMCLPAFPFKSANKVYKVLGNLPDKAEELALERLNDMCLRIGQVYPPGAQCTIISDGLVYNDLLSISDQHTWQYGEALRRLSVSKGFTHISFSRLKDLVFPNVQGKTPGLSLPEKLSEISYVANATNFRRYLLNRFGKEDLDIEHEIATNPDTLMTYRGYCRFLESDLQYIFPVTGKNGRSNKEYKRDVKYLAKEMLVRGYAFAGAVKAGFPNHLRLSIHQSTGEHKISMSLLNTKTGFTTPWHCSVALMADGEWLSAPAGDFSKDSSRFEVVYEKDDEGRQVASYFREMPEGERMQNPETVVDEAVPVTNSNGNARGGQKEKNKETEVVQIKAERKQVVCNCARVEVNGEVDKENGNGNLVREKGGKNIINNSNSKGTSPFAWKSFLDWVTTVDI